jgi:hypothetical protein
MAATQLALVAASTDKPQAYIHTSFFSVPAKPSDASASKYAHVADQELRQMLQDALATSARVAAENARLEAEKKELNDRITIVSTLANNQGNVDPAVLDAAIAAMRGRLLSEARAENDTLRLKLGNMDTQMASIKHELIVERASSKQNQARLENLEDVEALSEARARAVERLDDELVKAKVDVENAQAESSSLRTRFEELQQGKTRLEEESARLKAELEDYKQRNDKLAERLIGHGFESRVQKSQYQSPAQGQENPLSRAPRAALTVKADAFEEERAQLKSRISELERENRALQRERRDGRPGDNRVVESIKAQLVLAAEAIRFLKEDRLKEMTAMNGAMAALAARAKALETRLRKEMRNRRELKFYKFVAKKSQAELAAFTARGRPSVSPTSMTPSTAGPRDASLLSSRSRTNATPFPSSGRDHSMTPSAISAYSVSPSVRS